jgi:hypothetical protein
VYEFDLSSPNGSATEMPPGPPEPASAVEGFPQPSRVAPAPAPVEEPPPTVEAHPEPPSEPEPPSQPDEADRAVIAQLETSSPSEFFDQEVAEPKKRKWNLFRKGEDR